MLKKNPISNLRATQNLRATMGGNPYHNQHVAEFTACVEEALTELQQYYDDLFTKQQEQIDELAAEVAALKETYEKPVELEANVSLNQKSAKDLRARIMNIFKF